MRNIPTTVDHVGNEVMSYDIAYHIRYALDFGVLLFELFLVACGGSYDRPITIFHLA